jgi:lipopolysaccharide transport system permease protein
MNCFGTLIRHRRLIWNLTVLDVKVRYAGSRLGWLWLVAAPLLILSGYLVLFGVILKVQPHPAMDGLEYGILVAAGLLPWVGFSDSVMRGTSSVLAQRNLMKSRLFPMELIPVTAVCAGLVSQLVGMGLLLIMLTAWGRLSVALVLLPGVLLIQAMLSIGIVWFLSCVNILYRDTTQVVGLFMTVLMLVSPIAYTQQMVPDRLVWVTRMNPLSYLIESYRGVLLAGYELDLWGLATLVCMAVMVMLAGYSYFMHLRRILPDYV